MRILCTQAEGGACLGADFVKIVEFFPRLVGEFAVLYQGFVGESQWKECNLDSSVGVVLHL